MRRKQNKDNSGDRIKVLQIEILVVFAVIIMFIIFFLDYVILESSRRAMQQNASNLIAANSRQIELNINSYLERMRTIPTLLFSDEGYYQYDATDETIEEYDKVKSEENILNRIVDIGLMENYSDFGIVYADDHSVGWVSHGTQDLFPDGGLYDAFSEYATDTKTNDGWCFGINGCTDRIYYIKRLNPNAILESATYTRELASVFIYPEQLEQMTIRLIDKDNNIIFSSDEGEIGSKLPSEIADEFKKDKHDKMISDGKDRSIISDKYIINFNECTNGWGVVSSIPTDTILRDINELKKFTLRISIVIALFFLLIGLAVISNIYRPMDGMVASLKERAEMDMLSGVLNKDTFQGAVENRLNEKGTNDISIIIMLDVDNFKQINDKLGHAHGDQVIIRTGKMIRRVYEDDAIIGRLGGDEFAIYSECSISEDNLNQDVYRKNREELLSVVTEQLDDLKKEFEKEFKEEKKSCDISISAGVYLSNKFDDAEENFKLIYENADQALYVSKREGKNRYTIYEG